MLPSSGVISPLSKPISVVLPAPFGPMMACTSFGAIVSPMASAAVTPPKRRVNCAVCNNASATAPPFQQSADAAMHVDRDQQQDRSEDQIGKLRHPRQALLQQQKHDGADHRSEQ